MSFSKLVIERIFLSSLSYPPFPLPCTPPLPPCPLVPSSPSSPLVSAIIILYHHVPFSKLVIERIFFSSLSYPPFPLPRPLVPHRPPSSLLLLYYITTCLFRSSWLREYFSVPSRTPPSPSLVPPPSPPPPLSPCPLVPSSPSSPLVSAIIILYHRVSFSKLVIERIFLSSVAESKKSLDILPSPVHLRLVIHKKVFLCFLWQDCKL